jgi:alkanesulfonate monooxygenase SsuD/methylene tetrahydromethanopterin reductase-like flavin-dependent oxidoreductase (luciferase family)
MRTGIMLPNGIPGRAPGAIAEWAARAEQRGFDSLGVIDRVVYDCLDPFVALAAAATATTRVDLVTDLVVGPLRPTALLAQQAASVDVLSGGRLTLGLGVGIRPDDFAAAGADYRDRGARFDRQLDDLERIWAGPAAFGPTPPLSGGPRLLLGGTPELAGPRVARHEAGWTMAIGDPDQFAAGRATVQDTWTAAGRPGRPRTMAMVYAAVGPDAEALVDKAVGGYYAFLGPELVGWVLSTCAVGEAALATAIERFAAAGCDELMITPCSADPAQLDLIADVAVTSALLPHTTPEGHLA